MLLCLLGVAPVFAESRTEMPLPDYSSPIFVDENGCVFVRARLHGWNIWVQALDDHRQPVCDGGHRGSVAVPGLMASTSLLYPSQMR